MYLSFLYLTGFVVFLVNAFGATFGDFTYTEASGQITIPDYPTSASGLVEIPAEINGKPVTKIGDWAFEGCNAITAGSIPSSVTQIGGWAFQNCSARTSISLPGKSVFPVPALTRGRVRAWECGSSRSG